MSGVQVVTGERASSAAEEMAGPACYGYSIRSSLEFCALRPGPGTPLAVTEADDEPNPSGPPSGEWFDQGAPFARLWDHNGTYSLWIDPLGWFSVDPGAPTIKAPSWVGPRREVGLWGLPMALCFLERGDLPLHAAAVEVEGRAIVLAAPGRHGKTTLAGAFVQAGHRLLSEDLTCLRAAPEPAVLPGPALMRLRRDVIEHLVLPGVEVVAETPDRVLVTLSETGRGGAGAVPVGAVVFLKLREGETALTRRSPATVVPDLWGLSMKRPTDSARRRCFQTIAALAGSVPMWDLRRRLSFSDLPSIVERIVNTCRERREP